MRWLIAILFVKAVFLGLIIGEGTIGLSPDEAQYWTWSQDLDWGYYSKPPGIAWQIWLTTKLLGNHPIGVRFGALLIGFFLSLAVYQLSLAVNLNKKIAFWAAVVMAVSPLGVYLSFAATTDGGAILFLTLAAIALLRKVNYPLARISHKFSGNSNTLSSDLDSQHSKAVLPEHCPCYIESQSQLTEDRFPPKICEKYGLAGAWIGMGALFKWTAFLFWPIVFVLFLVYKPLRSWKILVGIAISLLALLPTLYWNQAHEWATFKHVGTTVSASSRGNFFDFFAAQMGLLSPIYFILLIVSYFFIKHKISLRFLAAFPACVAVYMGLAFFKKMQANWAAFLYPIGLPLISWVSLQKLKKGCFWLYLGTVISILMVTIAFMTPWLPVSYQLNPFRQSLGWSKLSSALYSVGYNPENNFLCADKYQNVSILSFYAPGQKRAYYFNISHSRKTQFSYWPQMQDKEKEKTGYFVVLENKSEKDAPWYIHHYQERLAPYFETIHFKGTYPLYSVHNIPVKIALIFECVNYNGLIPETLEIY